MKSDRSHTDIVIIGGGPVGLYLAGILGNMMYRVTVLEKKTEIDIHSKSLGIHPVSMELFDEAGISNRFLNDGIQIQKGFAFQDRTEIGAVDFTSCEEPFNFIMALPQYRTEQILEEWISEIETVQLIRGAEVTAVDQTENHVTVTYNADGDRLNIESKYLVGCDGKNSFIRQESGIPFIGKKYPDTYIMGDFSDNTGFGSQAAVYLHRDGLIESFPLPERKRRWVVKTDNYIEAPTRTILEALILDRLGHNLNRMENSMISSFGVQHFLADRFHSGRIALAGDSAHVVSPIGGQGMNLGWLTAHRLAQSIQTCLENPDQAKSSLNSFSENSREVAKKVAKRAELNMWLGRKRRFPILRNMIAKLIVKTPLQKKMAKMFTMRGL